MQVILDNARDGAKVQVILDNARDGTKVQVILDNARDSVKMQMILDNARDYFLPKLRSHEWLNSFVLGQFGSECY